MNRKKTLEKILITIAVAIVACVIFIPIISRLFLTTIALNQAEHVLQMKVKVSSAELFILTGSIHINDMAVYHPKREGETFIEADHVKVGLKILPIFIGEKPQLSVTIDSPKMVYATNQRGDWELKDQVPLFKRGKGERRLLMNVEKIIIKDGYIEYRDGRVGKTTKLTDIEADVKRVRLPTKDDPLPAKFDLTFKIDKSAKFHMIGRADFLSPKISFDSEIKLRSLPLPPFAPYYDTRTMPVRITRGTMAMTSHAKCKDDYLKAPAHMTLSGLQVEPKKTFILGFAADHVVDNLKDKKGRLELNVMISGNIRSPRFHITSDLSRAFAGSFAKTLVKDVPGKIEDIGKGIGSKIKGLFGK